MHFSLRNNTFFPLHTFIIVNILQMLSLTGCTKKSIPEDPIVAHVGPQIIRVSDFRRNYEFGLPHLKKGPDRKKSYLNFMINEKILALEGYHLGLDKSDRVQKLEKELLSELLVEEHFKREVNDRIEIKPEEIRDAITQSTVSWKLRYWVESDWEYANSVYQAMQRRGYADVVETILKSNPEVSLKPSDFETDYLTWLEVSPELLDAIKDLPIGQISMPIAMNNVYFILQIVDIRRSPITETDYQRNAERVKQILFYRKLKAEAAHYVSRFMTPKNVSTKGDAFRKLANGLAEWRKMNGNQKNFMETIESAKEDDVALFRLKNSLDQTLVTAKNLHWTIKDFINRFDPQMIKEDPENKHTFRSTLNQQIALTVRNHFFIQEARKNNLHKSSNIKKQLQEWRDKWVYEETRRHYSINLKIDEEQAKEYFEKYRDRYKIRWDDTPTFEQFRNQAKRDAYILRSRALFEQKIDSLKTYYPIIIDYAVLDTISTIDFQKSRWASLQVFKRSSNRLAVPIVDPAWGL